MLARMEAFTDLSALQRWILVVLSTYTDNDGDCYPSLNKLASVVGCSRVSVINNLQSLEKKGYITIKKRFDKAGDRATNLYTLNIEPSERDKNLKVVCFEEEKTKRKHPTTEELTDKSWAENYDFDFDN